MKAEIITIGDELPSGQVIDTNSAWMAEQLNLIGINVHQITSISDQSQHAMNTGGGKPSRIVFNHRIRINRATLQGILSVL